MVNDVMTTYGVTREPKRRPTLTLRWSGAHLHQL